MYKGEEDVYMKKVMVVGATGVLGRIICTELLQIFQKKIRLIVTDYKMERGEKLAASLNQEAVFCYLDVNNKASIEEAIHNVDIVIVALKQQHPYIQKVCIDNRILCIDVTPFAHFVKMVKSLGQDANQKQTGSIVMSGFFPGLSGLMVKKAASDFEEIFEINIGLLQNTNAKAGISGVLDMLKIISQRVGYEVDSKKVIELSGFTKKRKMYFDEEREVRLIDHAEKEMLIERFKGVKINYWTAWNHNLFNKQVSLLKRLGFINVILKIRNSKFLSKVVKHNPNQTEDAFLTVEVKGIIDGKKCTKTLSLSTFSDYHMTALVTAALAKIAINKKIEGVVLPFEIADLDEILSEIDCKNINLKEVI